MTDFAETGKTRPIPVTIIAGFLGAGKTTLLNRILHANRGLRVAVLVNDFGKINIDSQLLEVDESGSMISLPNGCICCTLYTNVIAVIQKLLLLPEPPEHIIIEASGVSSPDSVASILDVPTLQGRVAPDSVITLVDAENVRRISKAVSFSEAQIRSADILLVNKVDLVDEQSLTELLDWIRAVAPEAHILTTTYAGAPLELILGVGKAVPFTGADLQSQAFRHLAAFAHSGQHEPYDHSQEYESWSYTADEPLARERFQAALDNLPTSLYRAKGIVYLSDSPDQRYVLQVVGKRSKLVQEGSWEESTPGTQLVFIGEPGALNTVELQASLDRCLAGNPGAG